MATYPPPPRGTRFHLVAGLLTVAAAAALYFVYQATTQREPARGYTGLGVLLGIGASITFVGAALYSLRKRWGQEWMPGRLQTWLRVHVWMSLLATWAILLHAGFHLDDTLGAVTLALLAFTVLSGVIGWWLYCAIPRQVGRAGVDNLASQWTQNSLDAARDECDALGAGATGALKKLLARGGRGAREDIGNLPEQERKLVARAKELHADIAALEVRLGKQLRLRRALRIWLWLHIPAAVLFLIAIPVHIYDATDMRYAGRAPRPTDFASPESCLPCHKPQYDEWIASMHAMAMSSPTVDIQNRLVLAKEARDLKKKPRDKPLVGDLCVRCHAPTGSQPWLDEVESPLAKLEDRAPAGQFGISCVACHQISSLHASDPKTDRFAQLANEAPFRFRNSDNFEVEPGRVMHGPFGSSGELPSVGNAFHQGAHSPIFTSAELCASCHTVTVDDPVNNAQLKLQDTFREWEDGGSERTTGLNWAQAGIRCIHCHASDLGELVSEIDDMSRRRDTVRTRAQKILGLVRKHVVNRPLDEPAAVPADGFDLPLPKRRRFRHDFTGVDIPLDADLPYAPTHPRHRENPAIRKRMIARTSQLLRTAAAIQVTGVQGQDLLVDVANLATGHHLPAGFAFARELWIEVSTRQGAGAYLVHLGGRNGRPLRNTERLAKQAEGPKGLKNFQAVLWNGGRGDRPGIDGLPEGETVLQNEVEKVLNGKAANDEGFFDREGYLVPGEVRQLRIPLSSLPGIRSASAVRVRLRFRNFPPEFVSGLAARAKRELGAEVDHVRAATLVEGLHIFEVAEDELRLR